MDEQPSLCVSPLYFLFLYLGSPGRGRTAAICAYAVLTGVRVFWDLRRRVLFWVSMAIVVLCHVPLILLVHWTNNSYPGVVLLPAALLDYAFVYGAFKLVDKVTKIG